MVNYYLLQWVQALQHMYYTNSTYAFVREELMHGSEDTHLTPDLVSGWK